MDFDEYEYLENTVENPEQRKSNEGDGTVESEEKDRSRSLKHMSDNKDRDESVRSSKSSRSSGKEQSDPHKDRNHRHGSSSRDRERERLRHSERHTDQRDREKSRDREKIAEKDYKERRREMEFRDRDQGSRRHKEKKEEAEADPERDQRTVFAYQISLKASERDVYEFFSRAGKVRDVQLIMDRNSRRSKGFGYIEFYDSMSVPMAIAHSGQLLLGQPVMVKPSEAEKNLVQPISSAVSLNTGGARRIYVGNLPLNIKEEQIRQVFEPFGVVELVQMPTDPGTGNCKGYAFIQFARLEDAKAAQNLNGQLDIAGHVIKVSAVTDQVGMQEAGSNIADFDDDDEGSGLSLNAHSRAFLMQKLDRTGAASSINGSFGAPVVDNPGLATLSVPAVIDTIGVPSECLLLKNMFDPNSEVELDFDLDVKEDVQEECSKFGTLKHIFVDKNSSGFVYLRFENTESAIAAQRALHGRWFAGKMITATFMLHQNYDAKFPDSSS